MDYSVGAGHHRHDGGPIRTVTDVYTMTREEVLDELSRLRADQSGDVH